MVVQLAIWSTKCWVRPDPLVSCVVLSIWTAKNWSTINNASSVALTWNMPATLYATRLSLAKWSGLVHIHIMRWSEFKVPPSLLPLISISSHIHARFVVGLSPPTREMNLEGRSCTNEATVASILPSSSSFARRTCQWRDHTDNKGQRGS